MHKTKKLFCDSDSGFDTNVIKLIQNYDQVTKLQTKLKLKYLISSPYVKNINRNVYQTHP
ncbi:protein of unknown function [Shewanella benthica]|uniref:Uncharacterized protein n=1 Tax=Shewanella benthica TaxID=43661 RepID=A0A330LVZ1_9GAMM|nr:protein of unknown function [Shewanella benthica]